MKRPDAPPDRPQAVAAATAPALWEWAVAGLGALLLVATLGYLVYDAVASADSAPDPAVQVLRIQRQEGRFLVRVKVVNRGREPAAMLRVTGELRRGETVVEQSDTEFDFLPGRSAREAGLFFEHDPGAFELRLGARSFQQP